MLAQIFSYAILALASLSSFASAHSVPRRVAGKLGDAPVTTNNPKGETYTATFPERRDTVRGSISAVAGPGGKGVKFDVHF